MMTADEAQAAGDAARTAAQAARAAHALLAHLPEQDDEGGWRYQMAYASRCLEKSARGLRALAEEKREAGA
jgi:hypothetical protein